MPIHLHNTPAPQNLQDTEAPGDAGDVAGAGAAVPAPAAGQAPGVSGVDASGFEPVRAGAQGNILGTPPPAEGGGRTDPVNVAVAMARMEALKNKDPLFTGLVGSAEEGTAPAVPRRATVGSGGAASGAPTPQAPVAGAPASTPAPAPTPAKGSSVSDLGRAIDGSELKKLSTDMSTEATKIITDASVTEKKKCGKTDWKGENALIKNLKGMGIGKDDALKLARFLNESSPDSAHNTSQETVVAAGIAAWNQLNKNGKGKDAPAKEIVAQLTQIAQKADASTKSATGRTEYNSALQRVASYAVQVSNNSALAALTDPADTMTRKIVPYPIVVL